MSWLTPLGFLGLIGLVILLIIYLIKPNYQQKIISSTYVWKLSLKFRKKKLPISRLRDLLLILVQVLAISTCAFILAQPFIEAEDKDAYSEKIVVIDASASMLTEVGGETRFDKAVYEVKELAKEVVSKNGVMSVILAADEASFVVQRIGADFSSEIYDKLDALIDAADYKCTYGAADIDGAMKLAESVMAENPESEVILYTGTEYIDAGEVTVKSMRDVNDWNASLLNAQAIVNQNYYDFEIDVASYGRDADITVYLDIYGVNEEGATLNLVANARCSGDQTEKVIFGNYENATEPASVYTYDYAYVRIEQADSFSHDNMLYLYGGTKPVLKIQYYSALPNPFFSGVLLSFRDKLSNRWDVDITEVKLEAEPALSGFDIYIFEHTMPATLPSDGLVILANPDTAPYGSDIYIGPTNRYPYEVHFEPGEEHPLTQGMNIENITVTQYSRITMFDPEYAALAYIGEDPVLLAKNTDDSKVVVMPFSLNYSNLPLLLEFPYLMYNMIEYYVSSTITDYMFDVNETVTLNSRSPDLHVDGPGISETFVEFPGNLPLTLPGVYTLSQTPISGEQIVDNFYVKVPEKECNIMRTEDTLTNPYYEPAEDPQDIDLVFYFALALVSLLFVEWWLQSRKYY
ncbi:MAG: VWA domain-containing protein [Clostridia bacterium]|nr:VWA domain-containing protein [Clostridia bacterium]